MTHHALPGDLVGALLVFVLIPALVVGAVAGLVTRGKQRRRPVTSAICGFALAAIGGTLGSFLWTPIFGLIGAVIPSLIYLLVLIRISKVQAGKPPTWTTQTHVASLRVDKPSTAAQQDDQPAGSTRLPMTSGFDSEAAQSKSGIFISYRREDKRDFARVLYERLARHIEEQQIFMDVDSIELGLDFVEAINQRLAQCSLMLVVIGNQWLNCIDSSGRRRLDDPDDFVRLELQTALTRPDVRVIPILVDGAKAPVSTDLPESLRPLARRNALIMTHENFGADFTRLYGVVQKIVMS